MRVGCEWMAGKNIVIPVAAGAVISEGSMVAVDLDGYANEAVKKAGLIIVGCAQKNTDNSTGASGGISAPIRRGVFVWNNDGTIKVTDILKDCYVSDARTVTVTAEGSSRAGKILGLEDDIVFVEMI